jgi:glucose-6-phosphate 1-dehydrogenase
MRRKLLPALFHLSESGTLPASFHIIGVARGAGMTDDKFRRWARRALADSGFSRARLRSRWCNDCLHFHRLADASALAFESLRSRIDQIETHHNLPGNRVFYLALPPNAFEGTIQSLGEAKLNHARGWTRLVIEKPFGRDLSSAVSLNDIAHRFFRERQIYRIDHYLGKDTVQNLLALRFANALFESVWNRHHIKSVDILVAESLGVERRGAYYDDTGALRDIMQNHLAQLLTLTAMEPPAAFTAESVRFEKIKVLQAVEPLTAKSVVMGQYAAGAIGRQRMLAYRNETVISARSRTETFVAARLHLRNWRWHGVPFYLRTGKRLVRPLTMIAINFHRAPVALFRGAPAHHNVLKIFLQPDEGFQLAFEVKTPGEPFELQTRRMEFHYRDAFGELSSGYETLLLEIIRGDQTLFVHADEGIAAWKIFRPLLRRRFPVHRYPAGTWGPLAANRILAPGDVWTNE